MKTKRGMWMPLLVALAWGIARAGTPEIAGTWQGKLQVDPKTTLTIRFTFSRQGSDAYRAVLDSPDNGAIKNVAANAVSWDGRSLQVRVDSLSGSYAGVLEGTSIQGQWRQEGSALPLALTRYEKPRLSKAAIATLSGTWHGPLTIPGGGAVTFVVRFKTDSSGELQGTFAVPEQDGTETPLTEIEFAHENLSLKVPPAGEFTAKYANGTLVGFLKVPSPAFPPAGLPVTLRKGEFAPPTYALKLTSEQFNPLSGKWQGTLQGKTPQGQSFSLPLRLRFETNQQALYVAYIDSPSQGANGIAVTEASVTGGKLRIQIESLHATYQADVSGSRMVGQWSQGPVSIPLTFDKQ